jgi:hypothetical protein
VIPMPKTASAAVTTSTTTTSQPITTRRYRAQAQPPLETHRSALPTTDP